MHQSQFNILFEETGLTINQAAKFLGVRRDTVLAWRKERRSVPRGVLEDLKGWLRDNSAAGEK